jgi:hypothetical protein
VKGSLSDFSDYESSDEETHTASSSRPRRNYVHVSDNSDDEAAVNITAKGANGGNDPFADPFADDIAAGPSKK